MPQSEERETMLSFKGAHFPQEIIRSTNDLGEF